MKRQVTPKQKQQALERAYWKAHRHPDGMSVNLFEVLWHYDTIASHSTEEERGAMADLLAERMGFADIRTIFTDEKQTLLTNGGWLAVSDEQVGDVYEIEV